jgi:hypothetical protein
MSAQEFCDRGYLQEVNRLFFHPRGLALVIHKGPFDTLEVQDFRRDPEGVYIGELTEHDVQRGMQLAREYAERMYLRMEKLGFDVQPLEARCFEPVQKAQDEEKPKDTQEE